MTHYFGVLLLYSSLRMLILRVLYATLRYVPILLVRTKALHVILWDSSNRSKPGTQDGGPLTVKDGASIPESAPLQLSRQGGSAPTPLLDGTGSPAYGACGVAAGAGRCRMTTCSRL